jgi:Ca-activated chloride channel family protein
MMKRLVILSSFLLLAALLVAPLAAQEIFCPDVVTPCPPNARCVPPCPQPPIGGVWTNPDWLKIDHHRVTVEIQDQIARTNVDMEFVNEGAGLAEGTFVFPIPLGAAVEQLIMYINGQPIEARILEADEARAYYDEIVRQYRDPALLEYIGTQTVQANVFPIPPGETRRIEITYSQVLEADNGLIKFSYPMDISRLTSRRAVEEASISVNVVSAQPVSTIYSPTHNIVISRNGDNQFRVGWEQSFYVPEGDFTLYYGIASDTINLNLLTYRESATDDGFFMLLVQPPLELPSEAIIPRDIIVVLDQSGSMDGEKWTQARDAAVYVLQNLNPQDRFNLVLFSTGWRVFSNELESPEAAEEAINWVQGQFAEGGTDINGALLTALDMADAERSTTILFMTDGLPTEGETDIPDILDNVRAAARSNVRIFAFGVGNDVDTYLLDSITRDFSGTSSYVRPSERIDEEVASLYNKISSPVLTDVELDIEGVTVDSVYPTGALPDLFAGTQLTVVGRYRGAADDLTITLSGKVNGETQTFIYDGLSFRERAGGESFIARLWATRRIGDLLNTIRLNGENPELVNSIVNLSVRYGIITPYTSFLIDENDILTQSGREEAASSLNSRAVGGATTGADAVGRADAFAGMAAAEAPVPQAAFPTMTPQGTMTPPGEAMPMDEDAEVAPQNPIQTVGDKTFIWRDGVWTDTTFEPDTMETTKVEFLSDYYFDLLAQFPALAEYFAIGDRVIVVYEGTAYEVTVTE